MGTRYLTDSNVIIDLLADRLPEVGARFVERICDTDFLISVAVRIEVIGFDDAKEKMDALEEFLACATVLPLDGDVTDRAIALRRRYRRLRLGDAIIAATAMAHGLTLLSRNTSDFKMIDGLTVVNPHLLNDDLT
jgi:predicted nucleic acid-binding protein